MRYTDEGNLHNQKIQAIQNSLIHLANVISVVPQQWLEIYRH